MNFKKILTVGIKILAAAAAGFCVFVGFSKTMESKPNPRGPRPDPKTTPGTIEEGVVQEEAPKDQGLKVVHSLRKFQDTLGKLFSVAQSVSTVSENLYRIFKGGEAPMFGHRPLGNCPQGFTRISSNVIEAGYNPQSHPSFGTNKYWF